jgi:FG-GAP-like repeat
MARRHIIYRTAYLAFLAMSLIGSSVCWAQFETRWNGVVGNNISSIAVGDFNQDGKLDVATADSGTQEIAVMLGNGDGTFGQPTYYTVGPGPASIATAVFTSSGHLDLVVAGYTTSDVSVLLGNGDGTFQAPKNYTTTAASSWVGTGDFNGDRNMDLVILDPPFISVMLGNGDGTFQPPIDASTPYSPFAVGIGYFEKNNNLDLAVGGQGGSGNPNEVEILLGNGDGTFTEGGDYSLEASVQSIAVADFRANGVQDLAVQTDFGDIDILLGNGNGTFNQPTTYSTDFGFSVTAADLNGDGKPDLAVGGILYSQVSVLTGNGDGTFQPAVTYPVGVEPQSVATGDLNGDKQIDLAVGDFTYGDVTVLLNTGVARFTPTLPISFSSQPIGESSAPKSFTMTNSGKNALSISSISVHGQFRLGNGTTCKGEIASQEDCVIDVIFNPGTIGPKSGTISILDSASSKPQIVELSGQGTIVSLAPSKLQFTSQKVGTKSAPLPIQVKNIGSGTITFTTIDFGGSDRDDFSETNTCGSHLASGASCRISVTFKPTKKGARVATLFLNDNGGGSPQTVPLSGTGT